MYALCFPRRKTTHMYIHIPQSQHIHVHTLSSTSTLACMCKHTTLRIYTNASYAHMCTHTQSVWLWIVVIFFSCKRRMMPSQWGYRNNTNNEKFISAACPKWRMSSPREMLPMYVPVVFIHIADSGHWCVTLNQKLYKSVMLGSQTFSFYVHIDWPLFFFFF